MVASSLGAEELVPFEKEHGELEPGGQASDGIDGDGEEPQFVHPWAREMFKKGLSFNGNERNKLFLGDGRAGFEDLSDLLGGDSQLDGRAVLAADFDDDGDADIFVHNLQRGRHLLLRNDSGYFAGRHASLKVRLEATKSPYEAIGAVVDVEVGAQRCAQVLSRGAGFASCQAPELIFGVGNEKKAHVRVRWPGGELEDFGLLEVPASVRLVEGRGRAEPIERHPAELADPLPAGLKMGLGALVPELVLVDRDGRRMRLDPVAAAAGGRLYLAFWASYCRPCLAEIPELIERHAAPGSTVMAVSVDVSGHHQRALRALERAGANYPVAFLAMEDEANAGGLDELVDLLRLPIPTTLVIGPDGRIEEVHRGPLEPR